MKTLIFSIFFIVLSAYSNVIAAHDTIFHTQESDSLGEYHLISGKPSEVRNYFELVDIVDSLGASQKILLLDLIKESKPPLSQTTEELQKFGLVEQGLPFSAGRNNYQPSESLMGLVWVLITFLTLAVFANIIQWGRSRSLYFELGAQAEAQKKLYIMNKQMHEKAYTDALSGMGNRRAFFERGEAKLRAAAEHAVPMSALIIDIDHFKSVNDKHGHAIGDQVIQEFAGIVLETVRDGDIQGRIGGEEFALIASNTDLHEAEILAERIRTAAEKVELTHKDQVIKTTISVGVAAFDPQHDDLRSVMLRADSALYEAKETGRNRVVIHT